MVRPPIKIIIAFIGLIAGFQGFAQNGRYAGYHSAEECYDLIEFLAQSFPSLVWIDTIGYSERLGNPIIALRISDHPEIDEDEPCVMYDGLHHAREPISMEVCLNLAEHLLTEYGSDDQITEWVNETEIWIIPMVNPDGWIYCYDNALEYPYWRKNLRDNDENGVFNPSVDGVDVNRNYDYNWAEGGSGDFGSITYRGAEPFSESESRAKRDLALREKPSISLSYHTYGEIVIYSWSEGPRAPDQILLETLAGEIASLIPSSTGEGTYQPSVSNCQNGFSRCWMYAVAGSLEFTVECAKEFIPDGATAQEIAASNLEGALHILERVHGAGLEIHVKDAITMEPLEAIVSVEEIREYLIDPRSTDPLFGRFDKILMPGTYTLAVRADGYHEQLIEFVSVRDEEKTLVDVNLEPITTFTNRESVIGDRLVTVNRIYPNPFSARLTIDYSAYETSQVTIHLIDMQGRVVFNHQEEALAGDQKQLKIETRNSALSLPSGYYFLRIQTGSSMITRPVILSR